VAPTRFGKFWSKIESKGECAYVSIGLSDCIVWVEFVFLGCSVRSQITSCTKCEVMSKVSSGVGWGNEVVEVGRGEETLPLIQSG
jgi:hypothetical protein